MRQRRDGAAWRQLVALVRPWRGLLMLVAVGVLLSAVLELVPLLVIRRIVDEHLVPRQRQGLLPLAWQYLGATAGVALVGFGTAYLTMIAAQGALHALRVRLFAHLQQLPLEFFDRTPLGDIISRCTADIETLDTLFSSSVSSVVADVSRLVTVSIAMLVLSPPLFGVTALVIVPVVLTTNFFRVRVRLAEGANRRAIGLLNTHLQETLGGVEVIRAFGAEAVFVARFRGALQQALAAFNCATIYSATYSPLMGILAALSIALLLWAGVQPGFAAWHISIGTLTAFVLLFGRFFKPITSLGDEWQTVQSALSGAERVLEILALPAAPPPASPAPLADDSAIVLRDVVFGYAPNRAVLHGIHLEVRAGEQVAIVGRTGAGKSSILHLLGGLYAPWSGTVRVTGCEPRHLDEVQRRRVLGVVPQAVQLFSGTVRENLALGDATISLDAVQRAAQIAGADEFIQALPQGYDTPLGSSGGRGAGVQLSSGQRQLLALARALVWQPRVLLLDEATAALDSHSEALFRHALRDGTKARGLAILTVAHRLATAREADRVVVMEAGRIVEMGSPAELLNRNGRFAALVELEAAGWDWQDAPVLVEPAQSG